MILVSLFDDILIFICKSETLIKNELVLISFMAPGPDYHQNFVQHIMKYFKTVNIILVIILILTSYSYVFHFYLQSNASILAWSIFKKLIFKWKEDIKVIIALLIDIIWDYQTILNNVTDSKIPFTPLISTFYWRKTKGYLGYLLYWSFMCVELKR